MDKAILEDYIDTCEQIKETEKEVSVLKKKRKTIIQTNVSGSNPNFPYEKKHFKIQGTAIRFGKTAACGSRKRSWKNARKMQSD